MEIRVQDIAIKVIKKKIKNMHIYVKPEGVLITAPTFVGDSAIYSFAERNIDWIREKIELVSSVKKANEIEYITGDVIYIWGEPYTLNVSIGSAYSFRLDQNTAYLTVKNGSSVKQRELYLREVYRKMLTDKLAELVPKWESITGLYCNEWHTKIMKTRWGTCNSPARRLWFNVKLCEKTTDCLEYVVLHELCHIRVRNHGREFKAMLNKYMPNWKDIENKLNKKI